MANTLSLMDRELTVAMAGLSEAAMQKQLVAFARKSVADVIAEGRATPPYETFINGRAGPVESVVLPGPVVFVFNNFGVVIRAAIEELERRVPRRSGRYAASFVVLVNNVPTVDFNRIPAGATVTIFNSQPYTRKMETGANKSGARHFDLTKAALNRRFYPAFQVQLAYLNVPAGAAPGVPYILRSSPAPVAAKQTSRSSAFREGRAFLSRRPDRQAGQPITYPALVIKVP